MGIYRCDKCDETKDNDYFPISDAGLCPDCHDAGGLTLVQRNPDYAVQLDNRHAFYGWLFYRHPDGQFVSKRKLEDWEIMQAEDQRDGDIIIDGDHNVTSKSGGLRFG